jgi:hypothetical protein
MVLQTCNISYSGGRQRKIMAQGQLRYKSTRSYLKNKLNGSTCMQSQLLQEGGRAPFEADPGKVSTRNYLKNKLKANRLWYSSMGRALA